MNIEAIVGGLTAELLKGLTGMLARYSNLLIVKLMRYCFLFAGIPVSLLAYSYMAYRSWPVFHSLERIIVCGLGLFLLVIAIFWLALVRWYCRQKEREFIPVMLAFAKLESDVIQKQWPLGTYPKEWIDFRFKLHVFFEHV